MATGTLKMRVTLLLMLAVLAASVVALSVTDGAVADEPLTVSFFDVGQADATLLQHGDTAILIDQGDWRRNDVVVHLQDAGVERLDLSITTHPHSDHIGQFPEVLDAFEVDEVWWSGVTTTSQTFERALDALEASDASYAEPRAGDTTQVGELTIEIVNPDDEANFSDVHDSNLALRVTFGDVRLLFTGDAERATEARMVQRHAGLLDADIYQVGHHGSSTSTTAPFLDAVDPAVAIYSAGASNQYGHPHAEVLDRLGANGIETFGTDVNGTVTVTTDGSTVTVAPQTGSPFSFAVDGSEVSEPDAAFPDIGGNAHETAIVAIVEARITTGFADGTFRPNDEVTRGQMATFLYRGFELADWQPTDEQDCVDLNRADLEQLQQIVHIGPERAQQIIDRRPWTSVDTLDVISGIGPARLQDIIDEGLASISCETGEELPFSDVAGTTHATGILAVAQAEITGGFPDGTFRPAAPVTRGQMATFIANALDLEPAPSAFSDTAGTTHELSIGAVADAGIASGFVDGRFGPGEPVTRGQMATFLARALNLI